MTQHQHAQTSNFLGTHYHESETEVGSERWNLQVHQGLRFDITNSECSRPKMWRKLDRHLMQPLNHSNPTSITNDTYIMLYIHSKLTIGDREEVTYWQTPRCTLFYIPSKNHKQKTKSKSISNNLLTIFSSHSKNDAHVQTIVSVNNLLHVTHTTVTRF